MIPRYTREEMKKIWSEENKYARWLEVELAALEGWSRLGKVPVSALQVIRKKARIDINKIQAREKITQHDVIAFVEEVSASVGPEGKYIHSGLTSSDILDTSMALLLRAAGQVLLKDLKILAATLKKKARRYQNLPMMGRTHGVHAEPITLGFKFAGWYYEVLRDLTRLEQALKEISVGKFSGAVGTYSNLKPAVEKYACRKLRLEPEKFSTQIISRDRYAVYLTTLGLIAGSAERFALQIRLLQQTELSELAEPFRKGQKGSSAMPHKRNPVLCERICGLARVIRNNVGVALENMALWYERDISRSSAERIVFPDSTALLDYILNLLNTILQDLQVFPKQIERNFNLSGGVVFSQAVLNKLIEKGLDRKSAYELVQKYAFQARGEKRDFSSVLEDAPEIRKYLTASEIKECFDSQWFLRNIAGLFKKLT